MGAPCSGNTEAGERSALLAALAVGYALDVPADGANEIKTAR